MILITKSVLGEIRAHVEKWYPYEAAGFLLGHARDEKRFIEVALPQTNTFDRQHRRRRYLIEAEAMLAAEDYANQHGYEILGIFHSHPDHPAEPSDYDLERALPFFSYLITSVDNGVAVATRSWRLNDDRSSFNEEQIDSIETLETTPRS
jgi:proteasome lid subunit RPN8/RPN11